jgi:1-deoxy-D-xylulose-5-phosphate reductoisomerase
MMKRVAILGVTGSIGQNALRVLEIHRNRFELFGVSAHRNMEKLKEVVEKFKPKIVVVTDPKIEEIPFEAKILRGKEGLEELASHREVDIILVSTSGTIGVFPTIVALREGKRVALANKETLVSFGPVVKREWRRGKGELIPVDSEHSALWQLIGDKRDEIERIFLTASGGPFREYSYEELKKVKVEDALQHPTWKMGKKITVDSATLMNKGLEVIEAHWLFDIPSEKIEVLIHPQSIIHGLVELKDGAYLAHLSVPDMKIPILYALSYPERLETPTRRLDLLEVKNLNFEKPDKERFRCLTLAYRALQEGGTLPAVMNASNEEAVKAFLENKIGFLEIPHIIERVMESHGKGKGEELEELLEADRWARGESQKIIQTLSSSR